MIEIHIREILNGFIVKTDGFEKFFENEEAIYLELKRQNSFEQKTFVIKELKLDEEVWDGDKKVLKPFNYSVEENL